MGSAAAMAEAARDALDVCLRASHSELTPSEDEVGDEAGGRLAALISSAQQLRAALLVSPQVNSAEGPAEVRAEISALRRELDVTRYLGKSRKICSPHLGACYVQPPHFSWTKCCPTPSQERAALLSTHRERLQRWHTECVAAPAAAQHAIRTYAPCSD